MLSPDSFFIFRFRIRRVSGMATTHHRYIDGSIGLPTFGSNQDTVRDNALIFLKVRWGRAFDKLLFDNGRALFRLERAGMLKGRPWQCKRLTKAYAYSNLDR